MYEAATSCKDMAWTPITNWEPCDVTLARYCYAERHRMKVQLITPYCVSHLQHYSVTVHSNLTSVYPPYHSLPHKIAKDSISQVVGSCGWDNEPSGYVKCGEFLE
jgi:hypothetical protein